jgi:uncharacterized protein YjbJ (UPF0337 family)
VESAIHEGALSLGQDGIATNRRFECHERLQLLTCVHNKASGIPAASRAHITTRGLTMTRTSALSSKRWTTSTSQTTSSCIPPTTARTPSKNDGSDRLQFHRITTAEFIARDFVLMKSSTKDKIKGGFKEAKGKAKEKAGEATGNPDLRDGGTAEKAGGKVRRKIGDVKKVFEQ